MNKEVLEKYFNGIYSVEEAEQVVEWLSTDEGQAYLSDKFDEDVELLKNEKIKPMLPALDSKRMWSRVSKEVGPASRRTLPVRRGHASSYWYVAAMVFLVCGLSIFFYEKFVPVDKTSQEKQAMYFSTNAQQQKEITLSDGTAIRLNNNSQLWISATYGQPQRDVTLKGEAYFEVTHNTAKPFVIHTNGILIKDLGTAFNVRALPGKNNVQVAVESGKVSILSEENLSTNSREAKPRPIKLTGGQYAYLNLETDSFEVSEFQVENYLNWMSDQLKFDRAPLVKASEQLSHIYNVTFSYASDSLKTMHFSASFEAESLKRTLAVIALTLSIGYQIKGDHVIWKEEGKNSKILRKEQVN